MKKMQKTLLTQAVLASTLFTSSLGYATVVNGPTFPPVQTSIGGDIQILTTGTITGIADKDGVIIDTVGGKLIIDPNNLTSAAIKTTGAATLVAAVKITNPNAYVNVGANSIVNGANTAAGSDAILVNATGNATIINAGTIENTGVGADVGVEFFGPSTNSALTNLTGGLITTVLGVTGPTIKQSTTANGLTLVNAGTISQAAVALDTVQLNAPFTQFTNQSGGLITQTGGGIASVVSILGGGTSDVNNNAGATIKATGAGTIGLRIDVTPFGGSILNAGTISTLDAPALYLGSSVGGKVDNTGLMETTNPTSATILGGTATIKGGIINSGAIQSHGVNPAIDLSTNTTFSTFTQNAGDVLGDVLLGARDSNGVAGVQDVFHMNGGTITGNVTASTFAADTNLLTLSGGILAGNLTLGNNGDRVELTGTDVTGAITGGTKDDLINVSGGNFGYLDGGAGNNTLNILKTFTPNGAINNMDNINVLNKGTVLTLNNPITNMDSKLFIDANTQVNLNANISGNGNVVNNGLLKVTGSPTINLNNSGIVQNNGITSIANKAILTVKSNVANAFYNAPGGILRVGLGGLTAPTDSLSNGLLEVFSSQPSAVNLAPSSYIQPTFTGFIPQGSTFDVIKVNGLGGTIVANNSILQPGSAVITFRQSLNSPTNNILTLTAARTPYEVLSLTQVTKGIAGALDVLAQGNGPASVDLLNLLAQLDQLGTAQEVEAALESLAPPFNYGLIAGSRIGMENTFQSIQLRIEDLQARRRNFANGMAYGDLSDTGNIWGKVLGAYLNQKERKEVEGYKAKGAGIALGADWGFNDCTTFGIAGSYTKVNVDDKNASPKDQAIKSWQGTVYGWWEFQEGLYLDAMAGIASNHYKTNHIIHVNDLHTASIASFNGTQWGLQGDLGWALANCQSYYFAPFLRLRYIHLNLDQYTETGAGDIGLNIQGANNKEFMGGAGIRVGTTSLISDMLVVPELTALIGYDFKNDGQQSLASFIGGGPAFLTDGIKPGRTIFDLGLGVNLHMCDDSIFTLKYDLEVRSKFTGNVFYFQYNYFWS